MVRVTFWLLLLHLVLILKQSHGVSHQIIEKTDVGEYIKNLRKKPQNETFDNECKVSIYICVHKPFILKTHILKITELKHGNTLWAANIMAVVITIFT
jgi:hypothetical protein